MKRAAWPWLTSGMLLTVLSTIGLLAAGYLADRPASTPDFSSIYLLWLGLLVGLPMLAIGLRRAIDAHSRR